jgi:hypothetical protein
LMTTVSEVACKSKASLSIIRQCPKPETFGKIRDSRAHATQFEVCQSRDKVSESVCTIQKFLYTGTAPLTRWWALLGSPRESMEYFSERIISPQKGLFCFS